MPASESFIPDGTVEHTSHCGFSCLFFFEVAFINKIYPNALSHFPFTRHSLTTSDQGSLEADISENTLPFEGQSINNFSGIDISQSVDWERGSMSLHFLLRRQNGTFSAVGSLLRTTVEKSTQRTKERDFWGYFKSKFKACLFSQAHFQLFN